MNNFFFFNDTATTEIYTLSLHDALPIYLSARGGHASRWESAFRLWLIERAALQRYGGGVRLFTRDGKSTRLKSSNLLTSYSVFCFKKKNNITTFKPLLNMTTLRTF